jgi:peptidyl-prolyl cis-trans isomerase SurA
MIIRSARLSAAALWLVLAALPGAAWSAVSATDKPAETVEIDRIVAVVNNDIITRSELDEQLKNVRAQLRQQGIAMPPDRVLERQVLERMVVEQIELQLAHDASIVVDDDSLNQAISGIATQNKLSLAEFRDVLQQEGYDFAKFRENIRKEMTLVRLRQQNVDNRITVTDQEIDNFLAQQRRQGQGADEYHLGHILIALPEAATPEQAREARDKAQAALQRLKAGEDFGQVAISASDGQQALNGGDLGWRKAGEIPSLFVDVVPQMHDGEISDIIRSSSGFHIIKLIEHHAGPRHTVTQTHARHILIKTNELRDADHAQETLRVLRARAQAGESFEELARANSEDAASAVKGGDLGWVEPGQMVPDFEHAMDALQPGDISNPIKTRFGWHIIQVVDRRQHDDTDEFTRDSAREAIFRRKAEEEHMDWLRRLREEAYVEYRL